MLIRDFSPYLYQKCPERGLLRADIVLISGSHRAPIGLLSAYNGVDRISIGYNEFIVTLSVGLREDSVKTSWSIVTLPLRDRGSSVV